MTATSPGGRLLDAGRARPATAITVAVLGTIIGLAGAEHGVGEILQGSTTPDGVVIKSWPDTEAFQPVDGEPALTLIPDLLIAGIVTVLVSIVVLAWSARWLIRDGNGWVLIGLSALLLVVGGGFGPPLMGLIVGAAVARSDRSAPQQRSAPSRLLARAWPFALAAAALGYLSLTPGTALLSHFADVQSSALVLGLVIFSFSTLVLALVAARAADRARPELHHASPARNGRS